MRVDGQEFGPAVIAIGEDNSLGLIVRASFLERYLGGERAGAG